MKKIVYVCMFTIAAATLIWTWCSHTMSDLENNIIRLHIIANSDSDADQEVKLKVRDFIIGISADQGATPNALQMEREANALLDREHAGYGAKVTFGKYYIDRRKYESFILPGGVYTAARVELGDAKGQNWWCVLSPPLCFTKSAFGDTDELSRSLEPETNTAVSESGITVKLKALELAYYVKERLFS